MFHLCHFTYRFHWASVSRELSDGARQHPRQMKEGGVREGAEAMPNNVHIRIPCMKINESPLPSDGILKLWSTLLMLVPLRPSIPLASWARS